MMHDNPMLKAGQWILTVKCFRELLFVEAISTYAWNIMETELIIIQVLSSHVAADSAASEIFNEWTMNSVLLCRKMIQ